MSPTVKHASIDAYIATFPDEIQAILNEIRATLRAAIPGCGETISYNMPALTLNGTVLYFAAYKKHIGLYPPVKGDEALRAEIARYRGEKGNLQIPRSEPIPYDLIARIAQCRLRENEAALAAKPRK